jgi:hypothetical protein
MCCADYGLSDALSDLVKLGGVRLSPVSTKNTKEGPALSFPRAGLFSLS